VSGSLRQRCLAPGDRNEKPKPTTVKAGKGDGGKAKEKVTLKIMTIVRSNVGDRLGGVSGGTHRGAGKRNASGEKRRRSRGGRRGQLAHRVEVKKRKRDGQYRFIVGGRGADGGEVARPILFRGKTHPLKQKGASSRECRGTNIPGKGVEKGKQEATNTPNRPGAPKKQ